jgi:hypothetical protein
MMGSTQMLAIARVLGELLESYVRSALEGNRDCRLLVPGLTRNIARQLHDYLLDNGINSYLVIGEGEEPSETKRLLRAVGLTSKRIGSFVAIASPGQLVHIQDSIRGSGGTIRSMAFSEEWPWIDNGSEPFRFDGPVLDSLVSSWSPDVEEQVWLREFTLNGLLRYTRTSSSRTQLLLEGILGTFDPSLLPEIDDVREKLLFHSGVPRPAGGLPPVTKFVHSSTRLCQKIIERCQTDEDVRDQVRDMVTALNSIPEDQRDEVRLSVDCLLDGIGRSSSTNLGLLGFYSCWGEDKADSIHWRRLDAERLAELFNIREREKADVYCDVSCNRAVIANSRKKLASFYGEPVELDISYQIPGDQFPDHNWQICVLNRRKIIAQQVLNEAQGQFRLTIDTANSTERYLRKIPLRIALLQDDSVEADARIEMHLCGEDRPAFVVVEPGFEVVDATPSDAEEIPDKKVSITDPVHVFMFSHAASEVAMYDEDDTSLDVIETDKQGIWRSGQPVDVSVEPSGQAIRVCRFGDLSAVLCFEARDLEKGEFTLEDELRVTIPAPREKRLKELVDLFAGSRREPYPALGKVDDAARRRMAIATLMTSRIGWRPLLANLLDPASQQAAGSLGDFVNHLGHFHEEAFNTLTLPEDALLLLKAYSDTRDAVRKDIESRLDSSGSKIEHPIYATHPIFSHQRSRQTEQLLCEYMEAYHAILEYLEGKQKNLEWLQLFVLGHLDCVVHWDSSRLRNALFLVGPWHPLVLAKRYMVQAALFSRAHRLLHEQDGKAFRRLSSLLGRVQGFRWLLGLSADDRLLEPVHVSTTSDPGWHLAFKTDCSFLATEEGLGGLAGILGKLRYGLGLATEIGAGGSENLAVACLGNYLRAFPSRRSIGMRVRRGYAKRHIVTAIDSHLHAEEGSTEQGRQLPGGVRMYFEEPVGNIGEARWVDPPLYVYTFEDDAECIRNEHPDIYMLPPMNDLSFKDGRERYRFPRGTGRQAVFSQSLNWLTEGQTLVPKSITYEADAHPASAEGIGGVFCRAVGKVDQVLGKTLVTVRSVELPQRLDAPWVVIPGEGVDPAVLVKYVRDGADRAIQERALWDYKLDIANKESSFFILSTVPKGFQVAVNGFFGRDDIAGSFIVELGRIGIAIGGEALKSGRHALGVVSVVGAVRLFQGAGSTEPAPLACTSRAVGFLVPVDSFSSFFGKSGSNDADVDGKRTDLLAIRIVLARDNSGRVAISCCGVESKFTSGTFGITRAHAALDQARATTLEFRNLVETSLRDGATPERLALLELLKFGLRITSPSQPSEIEKWINTEAAIYGAVLSGNYEYCDAAHNAVLVTTEEQLPGVTEHVVLQEGLWIRLTRGHWPGISDTPQLDLVRQKLSGLFSTPFEAVPSVEPEAERPSAAAPSSRPTIEEASSEAVSAKQEPTETSESIAEARQESAGAGQGGEIGPPSHEGPLERILMGVDEGRRAVYFNPQSLVDPLDNTNLMVTGSSGTGKTQLLKYLICRIREQKKPVLVLDFKNDFASDSAFAKRSALDRIFVTFDGLPYNPLIPYPVRHPATGELYVQCAQHVAGVASVLRRTYGLGAQQQAALKNAMVAAFATAGISTSGSARYSEDMRFPDFSLVGNTLQHDNAAAYNRLDPLFTLGLFRDEFRNSSFQSLVGRSAILDLSQIPSDEIKNTLAQLVVLSAHAYHNSQPHSGTIRQVLVFDEAHRVLNSDYMLRLVRECRAYGVAAILSSQYPSDFPGEISASMATKVVHGNGRDSEKVKTIVQLIGCDGREGDVANLDRFQAFVDNRHYPHTLVRTMNYPLYLVWSKLQELGTATREELSHAEGVDTSKLPIGNLVRQLERLGLAEEREGRVFLLERA